MRGCCVPILHNVAWAEDFLRTKWHLNPCSRLATIDTGRKFWALSVFGGGELGFHLTQCRLIGSMPTSLTSGILIHLAIWPQQIWVENWGAAWGPIYHNMARVEVYPPAKFHLDPSNRLATIHQRYRQTDTGQRSDSIRRAIL